MGSNDCYRSLPIKAVAASVAVLSAAVMLHFAGPSIMRFASAEVPKIYGTMISWLTPPYLYFVINVIIISIAASSRFTKSGSEDIFGSGSAPAPVAKQEFIVVAAPAPAVEEEVKVAYTVPVKYGTAEEEKKYEEKEREEEEEEFVISRSTWTPKRREKVTVTEKATEIPAEYPFSTEKPLVSARLGRRKSSKASPEAGKALRVARPKRNDTLESTWKTITEGRAVPLPHHLKKSDTWETQHHTRASSRDDPSPDPIMRQSETFKERGGAARCPPTSSSPSPLGSLAAARLRKEPSLGQDDLNRRVEAFIKNFNEEMRLQRQESFKHYLDMINRGSH